MSPFWFQRITFGSGTLLYSQRERTANHRLYGDAENKQTSFHLTDDNGWRIEIKKYPRLTEVGAWRVDRTDVPFHSRRNPKRGELTPIGGFYTQEEIREIVAYAADRQIEVIPEIDVPAHSNAALAAYPSLLVRL